MMNKLAFQTGKTWVHQLYPITKLGWLLLGSMVLFVFENGYILISIACISLILLIYINKDIWKVRGFRIVIFTGFLLFFLYLLFVKDGQTLFHPGIERLKITSGGIEMGYRYSGRFFAIVFLSYIFILTTEPSQLALALMRMGVPYRFGFMLVTALRLAPILEEEGRTIYQAQLVRGVRYDQGNLRKMFLLIQQFLTPLLISSIRRVDHLVFSMEGRGFGRYPTRTFRQKILPTKTDLLFSLVCIALLTIVTLIEFGWFI